jgi:hypothetical protein
MNYKRIKKMSSDNAVTVTEITPKRAEQYSRIPPLVRTDFVERAKPVKKTGKKKPVKKGKGK